MKSFCGRRKLRALPGGSAAVNFGSFESIIRAFPNDANQAAQTKVFDTGGWFTQEDMVPSRLYFDRHQPARVSNEAPPHY